MIREYNNAMARSHRVRILKIKGNNFRKELDFEIEYQLSLTVQERFKLMFSRADLIKEMLIRNGYRKPIEIIKRK
jgi:hypothetical protein